MIGRGMLVYELVRGLRGKWRVGTIRASGRKAKNGQGRRLSLFGRLFDVHGRSCLNGDRNGGRRRSS